MCEAYKQAIDVLENKSSENCIEELKKLYVQTKNEKADVDDRKLFFWGFNEAHRNCLLILAEDNDINLNWNFAIIFLTTTLPARK